MSNPSKEVFQRFPCAASQIMKCLQNEQLSSANSAPRAAVECLNLTGQLFYAQNNLLSMCLRCFGSVSSQALGKRGC